MLFALKINKFTFLLLFTSIVLCAIARQIAHRGDFFCSVLCVFIHCLPVSVHYLLDGICVWQGARLASPAAADEANLLSTKFCNLHVFREAVLTPQNQFKSMKNTGNMEIDSSRDYSCTEQ